MDLGEGIIVPSLASNKAVMQEMAHFTISGMVQEAIKWMKKMVRNSKLC